MTASTGTGREAGRHTGVENAARKAAARRAHLGVDIRHLRRFGVPDDLIATRLCIAAQNVARYASLPEPEDPDVAVADGGDGGRGMRRPVPDGDQRAADVRFLAIDLIRCVAAGDAEGIRLLLHKVRDWYAFAVVLAAVRDEELGRPLVAVAESGSDEGTAAGGAA